MTPGRRSAPEDEDQEPQRNDVDNEHAPEKLQEPLRFKQSPIRLHPGEKRTVTLLANPALVPEGSKLEIEADPGITVTLRQAEISKPGSRGISTVQMGIRARVSVEAGLRLTVLAAAAEHTAQLELIIVRHRASGWVREIARKNNDQSIEAEFDPETGVVTVYEGRREFRELERAAHRAGYTRKRAAEYIPFRMLEVEAAANAVYHWAATEVIARRIAEERPTVRRVRPGCPPRSPSPTPPRASQADGSVPGTRGLRREREDRSQGRSQQPAAARRRRRPEVIPG